jgi:ATP adenylyltransferase
MAYIKNARKLSSCIFCVKARKGQDRANLVLYRGEYGFVMMNLFPYNSGHLMVAPYAHVDTLESLPAERSLELIRLTNLSLQVLREEIGPEGFNVGLNLGRVSGAGIEAHVHLHVVPRWNGDTNFMPLFAETRVIPEHIRATYRKLRRRFRSVIAHQAAALSSRTPARRTPETSALKGNTRSRPRISGVSIRPVPKRNTRAIPS